MQGIVKRIFLQIREQLDEPSHPLIRVIKDFQFVFSQDMKAKIRDVSELQENTDYFRQKSRSEMRKTSGDEFENLYAINRVSSMVTSQSEHLTKRDTVNP